MDNDFTLTSLIPMKKLMLSLSAALCSFATVAHATPAAPAMAMTHHGGGHHGHHGGHHVGSHAGGHHKR